MALSLLALLTAATLIALVLSRARTIARTGTWDCGYARPTARMQYTGSSFGQTLVNLFTFIVWPRRQEPEIGGTLAQPATFTSDTPDTVLDRLITPVFRLAGQYLPRLRVLQQGQTYFYVLYVVVIVIVLLLWGAMGARP